MQERHLDVSAQSIASFGSPIRRSPATAASVHSSACFVEIQVR